MNIAAEPLPNDPEELKALVLQLQDELQTLDAKVTHQTDYINQLIEAIKLARQQHFGSRSEKFQSETIEQLAFLFNEPEVLADLGSKDSSQTQSDDADNESTAVSGYTRKASKGGRRKLPDHLPRIEVIHELDESGCQCDKCQGQLKPIGTKTSEQLEFIPMTVKVIRHIKTTYSCPNCKQMIKAAKLPPQPIPGSIATPATIAHIINTKYVNAMPLYRQAMEYKRLDIPISRSTLANWMIKAGVLIQPLINLMRESMLSYDIIQIDETRCQVLKEPGRTPQSQSYVWVQRGGLPSKRIILYDYAPSRSQTIPIELLGDYAGYLQTDGYQGYNKVCEQNKLIQLGCWAHVRRKFKDVLEIQGKLKMKKVPLAKQALQRIQLLYKIEKQAKGLTPDQIKALRQSRTLPVLKDLRKWLDLHLPVVVQQSALGKAMKYMHDQWDKLTVYTTDGRLQIDNNHVENNIRPFTLGRKNWLFCDTVSGAKASANLYSLVETAKANGLEPYQYLRHIFTELPKATTVADIEALLPFNPKSNLEQAA